MHGGRHRLHGRGRRRDRRARRGRGRPVGGDRRRRRHAGRARRPRHAAPRGRAAAARSRARPRHHAAPGRARLGGRLGQGRRSAGATPLDAERERRRRAASSCGIATEGRRPPRADCAVLVDGAAVGDRHQRQLLAGARPRHRPGLHAARHRDRHRGRRRRARHRRSPGTSWRRRSSPSADQLGACGGAALLRRRPFCRRGLLGRSTFFAVEPSWPCAFFAVVFVPVALAAGCSGGRSSASRRRRDGAALASPAIGAAAAVDAGRRRPSIARHAEQPAG